MDRIGRRNSCIFIGVVLLLIFGASCPAFSGTGGGDADPGKPSFSARTPVQGSAAEAVAVLSRHIDGSAQLVPAGPITQNVDTATITVGNSVSCNSGSMHTDNSYFRRFDLDGDHGLSAPVTVGSVDIGIEQATGGTGEQPVEVRLYSIANADALALANLSLIETAAFSQADANQVIQNYSVSGTVNPQTDDLVVELFTPNGQTDGSTFFIGSNAAGEIAPSYIVAADCGISDITSLASIGFSSMHIVMLVNGPDGKFAWPMFMPAVKKGP